MPTVGRFNKLKNFSFDSKAKDFTKQKFKCFAFRKSFDVTSMAI